MNAMGLLIYAKQCEALAQFYATVAGLQITHREPTLRRLEGAGVELLVHGIPDVIARDIRISSPPQRREDCALKLILSVPSLEAARLQIETLGGAWFAAESWRDAESKVCNAMDPEGNVFQLREPAAPP
jgi:predicted enzyme related to lactoylglutathione lyase